MTLGALLGVIAVAGLGLGFVVMFNSLVAKKNDVENAFASVDTLLKKRYDLIPNLVSSVKAYVDHEQEVLAEVTELRAQAVSEDLSLDEAVRVGDQMSAALRGLFVSVEDYPELRASENFELLQRSLNEVEAQISAARRAFNAAVTDYNDAVEMFPTNLMARMMSYDTRRLFEVSVVERQNVDVAGGLSDHG